MQNGGTCTPCEDNCLYCDQSSLSGDSSSGACLQCYDYSYLYMGSCVDTCPDAFYEETSDGQCHSCDEKIDNCIECETGDSCLRCDSGFYLFGDRCMDSCPENSNPAEQIWDGVLVGHICEIDPCMIENSSGSCTFCLTPFILQNGECISYE